MGINNKRNLNVDIDELIKEEERIYNVELNEGQKNAIKEILQHNVSLLTGGGGTGKSFSTSILLNIIEKIQGENFKPTLCALSGKASKVLANSTGREAKTIHRTLGFAKGGFSHSENDKLDTSILIVDEISMCPNDLLSMLLTALEEGTYVLFIGDDNQLTSIGFSNSIHDFTKMKNMNCINLTQPMRQAMKSGILEICTSIRNETNPFAKKKEYTYGELQDMNVVIGDKYNEMINNFVNAFDVNNKLDYVALGCTKKLTSKINLDIQQGLIKKGKLKEDEDFIEVFTELKDDSNKKIRMKLFKGDVCLIVKNNYNILTFDEYMNNLEYGSATLFNGNTVIIKEVYTDACLIETEDGEELVIRDESYEIIAPGYSYSIHKSQGSSIKHCYIYLENNYVTKNMLLVNEALYTAISRAKSTCEMYVEDYSVLSKAIKNKEINNRQTILELLIDGLIK
jgi:exodeoxyribonuclease V alpha subunit